MKCKFCVYFILVPIAFGLILNFYIHSLELGPELMRSIEDAILNHGYGVEVHTTETRDGYFLTMFRIVNKNNSNLDYNPHPVLMIPGLTTSAQAFVVNPDAKAPAFQLADEGYDVWLGNQRGNRYSRRHKTYNVDSEEFWDFTVAEISEIDLPAMIHYVKQNTGRSKISYIGYSQGGIAMVNLAAVKPEIADSLNIAVAWTACAGHITGSFWNVKSGLNPVIQKYWEWSNTKVIGYWPSSYYFAKVLQLFINIENYFGYDSKNLQHIALYIHQMSGGTSHKNMELYRQIIERDQENWMYYDYGPDGNINKYGSQIPKVVDYSQIRTKFAIMGGEKDDTLTSEDIQKLISLMPKKKVVFDRVDYNLTHSGFVLGNPLSHMEDTKELLARFRS